MSEAYGTKLVFQTVCADIPGMLSELSMKGIKVRDVRLVDGLTVNICIYKADRDELLRTIRRLGGEATLLKEYGATLMLRWLWKRWLIPIGILMLLLTTTFLQERILFVAVEGNDQVPEKQIIETAGKNGVAFGTIRSEIRSEQVKNALLQDISQLRWVGVNTRGCVATISVSERTAAEEKSVSHLVSSIVAVRDGVIDSVVVSDGNPLCAPGQAVRAGEVLISGYTDCGLKIDATRAKGEVYGLTRRSIVVCLPKLSEDRMEKTVLRKNYGLIIGKKRINLFKDSGIYSGSCDKMYEEYQLCLPGGYVLPVALTAETWYTYETAYFALSQEEAKDMLSMFARDYLLGHMLGGEILSCEEFITAEEDRFILVGHYLCREMIGREYSEEIIR